jgi:hypothetical protein
MGEHPAGAGEAAVQRHGSKSLLDALGEPGGRGVVAREAHLIIERTRRVGPEQGHVDRAPARQLDLVDVIGDRVHRGPGRVREVTIQHGLPAHRADTSTGTDAYAFLRMHSATRRCSQIPKHIVRSRLQI